MNRSHSHTVVDCGLGGKVVRLFLVLSVVLVICSSLPQADAGRRRLTPDLSPKISRFAQSAARSPNPPPQLPAPLPQPAARLQTPPPQKGAAVIVPKSAARQRKADGVQGPTPPRKDAVGQGPPTTHPATTRKQPDPVAWLFTDGGVPYEFLLTPGSASTASQVNFFQFSPFAERCRYSLGPVVDALFAVPISCKQSPNGVLDVSQMSYRDKCFSIFVGLCLSLIVKARVFPAYTESFHAPTADSLGPSFQVGERLLFDLENPIELLKIVEHYLLAIVENESADSTIRALATSVICVIAQTKSTVEAVVNSTPSCRLNANRQRIYAAVPQSQSQLQLHRDAMGRVISAAQDLLAIIQALFRSTDANFNISDWFFLIMGKILQGRDFWLEDDGLDAVLATKADVRTILDCLIKSLSPAELGQVAHD